MDPNSGGSLAVTLLGARTPGFGAHKSRALAGPAQRQALLAPHEMRFNFNTLLTHKDWISHRNAAFWLLWIMEALASVGPHSCI